jgi:hypothetical protein
MLALLSLALPSGKAAGSAKQVMLASQFHATVDLKRLPIQRRSTASYGR